MSGPSPLNYKISNFYKDWKKESALTMSYSIDPSSHKNIFSCLPNNSDVREAEFFERWIATVIHERECMAVKTVSA